MWGLAEYAPWFFSNEMQTEACHRLVYLLEQGEPFAALEGRHGSGKSTVLRQLRDQLSRQRFFAALINAAALDEISLLWSIASALSVEIHESATRAEVLRLVGDELAGRAQCGHRTVLLLDDVDLSFEDISGILHGLVAMGRHLPGSVALIAATELPLSADLSRNCPFPVRLTEFAADESVQFLRQMLVRKDADLSHVDDAAITLAAAEGDGSPGQLVRICDALKAVHVAHPNLTISADVVEEAARELLPRRAG